ncbi:MAG TPA: DNA oxidative demethylase AlkB [Nevskia sp.]|nr:DNA oxidative demethylase AlkB [Nevskia sp.]
METLPLFAEPAPPLPAEEQLADGAMLLRGFATAAEGPLLAALRDILAAAPFRHLVTPGGQHMSVAMTNCGSRGWISDRRGYRYESRDPDSGSPWPPLPPAFARLATSAAAKAGYEEFVPDACLINRYVPGTKLSLHQDRDERDLVSPIVSVSLGIPAVFLFGGLQRKDPQRRVPVEHGDVVVWGGASRLRFHGVLPLKPAMHPLLGAERINLSFRKAA